MAATVPEPLAVPEVIKEDIEDEKEEPELILEVNRTIFFFMFAPMVGNCGFNVFHFNRMKKNSRKKS